MKKLAILILGVISLSACSQMPDGRYSLRQTLADAIAPQGYTPNAGQADMSGMQQQAAGAINSPVALVTIRGKQSAISVGVGECDSVPVSLTSPNGYGENPSLFLTKINGAVYASPYPVAGCRIPYPASYYPYYGAFPLNVRGQNAEIHIRPGQ